MIIERVKVERVEKEWTATYQLSAEELKTAGLTRRQVRGLLQYLAIEPPALPARDRWRWTVKVRPQKRGGCFVQTRYLESLKTVVKDEGFPTPQEDVLF